MMPFNYLLLTISILFTTLFSNANTHENINSKVTYLKDCKDSNDTDKIKSAIDDLNGEWSKVSQDLYNASQQAPENAADVKEEPKSKKTNSNNNDNVENVDYEVVDDEKDK